MAWYDLDISWVCWNYCNALGTGSDPTFFRLLADVSSAVLLVSAAVLLFRPRLPRVFQVLSLLAGAMLLPVGVLVAGAFLLPPPRHRRKKRHPW